MVKDRISDENAYEMVVMVPTGYWWQGYCLVKTIYALLRSELVWFNVAIKTGKKEMGIKLVSKTLQNISVFTYLKVSGLVTYFCSLLHVRFMLRIMLKSLTS